MKKGALLNIFIFILAFTVNAQNFTVDTEKSDLKWTGKKVTGQHNGSIELTEGSFTLNDNRISKGMFVINMTTITNKDLSGETREKLVGHLKSDDFFSVENHPTSVLKLNNSTKLQNGKTTVKGELTIKGITHPIEFEGTKTGNVFEATINVDRTKYNVRYGSGKFFENLGDNMIYDDFILDITLVTNKE
ncbi:MAG: YceI family protein [Prolixibacteraceae bacterium]|jgi:polyisoprenoid-binding protein YceI|nr:YceI family protein [Prolixibacteraceae bacterium]